jgi:hypothetical protein
MGSGMDDVSFINFDKKVGDLFLMLEKPIFIVGVHRTGSTLVKNMLDLNSEIAMLPEELHLWDPYPWAKVVLNYCKHLDFSNKKIIKSFVEELFSKTFYGSFWKNIDQYGLNKNKILSDLDTTTNKCVNCKEVLDALFNNFLENKEKKRLGIKYPIHISKISLLNTWYPDCKIIHLIRDPRAVYSSKSNDEFTKRMRMRYKRIEWLILLTTMIRVVFEYNWSRRVHTKYEKHENYILLKYEDLVSDPEEKIKDICEFLDVSFQENMLFPYGKPSSHSKDIVKGFDKSRINTWHKKIQKWEKNLVDLFANKSIKKFNYN